MTVRKATAADLAATLDIYNYEVLHGVATLDIHPRDEADWRDWMDRHNRDNHPLLVAERQGEVVGYASLSPYRPKEAYRSTVELSVYVAPHARRQGVAAALMDAILRLAAEDERTHTVVSVITAGNEASLKLHERYDFTYCGTIREAGEKFGRMLDVEQYQKMV